MFLHFQTRKCKKLTKIRMNKTTKPLKLTCAGTYGPLSLAPNYVVRLSSTLLYTVWVVWNYSWADQEVVQEHMYATQTQKCKRDPMLNSFAGLLLSLKTPSRQRPTVSWRQVFSQFWHGRNLSKIGSIFGTGCCHVAWSKCQKWAKIVLLDYKPLNFCMRPTFSLLVLYQSQNCMDYHCHGLWVCPFSWSTDADYSVIMNPSLPIVK